MLFSSFIQRTCSSSVESTLLVRLLILLLFALHAHAVDQIESSSAISEKASTVK